MTAESTGQGNQALVGKELQGHRMESSRILLHNFVNIVNIPELYT